MSDRQLVSRLVMLVLTNQMHVRQAIANFPKDATDKSIIAAFHALMHYEADEDLRNKDLMYKEEQDAYLALIADTLSKNRSLPKNILDSYKDYYSGTVLPKEKSIKNILKSLCRFLNVK